MSRIRAWISSGSCGLFGLGEEAKRFREHLDMFTEEEKQELRELAGASVFAKNLGCSERTLRLSSP